MLFQMDEAISNVGMALAIFDYNEKLVMKECWQQWGLKLWNALHEHLTDVNKAQSFINGSYHVVRSIFSRIDPKHPGHVMITTIVAFGPYYTARHISALKSGKSDMPISVYRYFGDKAFCRKWQQNMRKVGLEITNDQLHKFDLV